MRSRVRAFVPARALRLQDETDTGKHRQLGSIHWKLPSGNGTGLHASKTALFVIRVSQILLRYEQLVHE